MKLSRRWIVLAVLFVGGGALAYQAFDLTRFRSADYECDQGPGEIKLHIPGELPDSGIFSMTGYVDRGELTVVGFPAGREGETIHFTADDGAISQAYNGEWYDAPTSVQFKPDSPDAICSIRIVYRMKNEWSRIIIGNQP